MTMKIDYPFKYAQQVLVRRTGQEWIIDVYIEYKEGTRHPYYCAYKGPYDECLPITKETFKLMGTKRPYKGKLVFTEEVKQHTFDIEDVLDYLNETYTQQTVCEERTAKIPEVEVYNGAVISFWACGAFVAINHIVYNVAEDDMHWYLKNDYEKGIDAAFIPSIIRALTRIDTQLKKDPRI